MIFRKASLRLEALIFFLFPWGFMGRRKPNSAPAPPGLDSVPMPSPSHDPRAAFPGDAAPSDAASRPGDRAPGNKVHPGRGAAGSEDPSAEEPEATGAATSEAERGDHGTRDLPSDRVEVWVLSPEDFGQQDARADHAHLLSAAEQARHARFHGDRLRHDFLMARALVRRTLSRYEDVPPEDWSFEIGSHGKPSVAASHGSRLRFNLSHTRGLIACAVRLDEEVGLDVETSARRNDIVRIAERFFSAEEVRALHALPVAEHRARFFTYWALKEAYIKARGLGLAIPLGAFTFRLDSAGPIEIALDQRITEDPGGWRFHHRWATDVHSLAVATPRSTASLEVHVQCARRLVAGMDGDPA